MAKKPKRSVIHVVHRSRARDARDRLFPWRVLAVRLYDDEGCLIECYAPHVEGLPGVLAIHRTKALAVQEAIEMSKEFQPSSLRIHGKDGKIQEERTYPRSSDPKRTRG